MLDDIVVDRYTYGDVVQALIESADGRKDRIKEKIGCEMISVKLMSSNSGIHSKKLASKICGIIKLKPSGSML